LSHIFRTFLQTILIGALASCSMLQKAPPQSNPVFRPFPHPMSSSTPSASSTKTLPAATPLRNWDEYRLQAAKQMVTVNAGQTYLDTPPEILLAIPVLQIELNANGSVRKILVLRYPGQALDTTQLAIQAVNRAAPFGDVSRLPKPWRFTETFLFRDDRKFKPRILDAQ
jgi:hypothetical protein